MRLLHQNSHLRRSYAATKGCKSRDGVRGAIRAKEAAEKSLIDGVAYSVTHS